MFGDRLKLLRKKKGLTQKDLSGALGVSQGHISALEKNDKLPGSEILVSLKQCFGIDLNWILMGEGEEPIVGRVAPVFDDNPEVAELLEGARKVLTSGNPIAFDALERNIRYFSHAIEVEKRMGEMEAKLAEVDELKRYVMEMKQKEEARDQSCKGEPSSEQKAA